MDTATNEFEEIAIKEMLDKGVDENLIRAFSWARQNVIAHGLIEVSKAHAMGKIGEFSMFDSMQHVEKAVAALAKYGYKATIQTKEDCVGFQFMTAIRTAKTDGLLLIEPRLQNFTNE